MRLDPNQLIVNSFEISGPGSNELMATEGLTCVTTAPCLNSAKTCDPNCLAVNNTVEN